MSGGPKYHWNYFWKSDIPTKMKCFTWASDKERLLNTRSPTELGQT